MKSSPIYLALRIAVAALAVSLFAVWMMFHILDWLGVQNGLVRLLLGLSLGGWILLRRKQESGRPASRAVVVLAVLLGLCLTVVGLVLRVRQLEWIGILGILYGCLRWALPPRCGPDLGLAFFLLYWVHPLPIRVFFAFQVWMQRMSVLGAEWLLHVVNVRVWADGLVLRTGLRAYDVPAWCSGMRTATTVFLLAIGLGIVRRLRGHAIVLLTAAAVVQALGLNILRIAAMVLLTPTAGERAGVEFLHHTAGIIVILAVVLVYLELLAVAALRRRYQRYLASPDRVERQTELPAAWWMVLEYKWLMLAVIAAAVAAGGLAHRSRTAHRVEMIKGVAVALREFGDLSNAQRAADRVRVLAPEDNEWRYAAIRLLLLRGRYREVLDELAAIPPSRGPAIQKSILGAYALMGLDRIEEAAAIVRGLPESTRREDPRVAMVLAEIALYADDADRVAEHVLTAARWRPNLNRIRALYPYLRMHGKWQAIAATDLRIPFEDPVQAFSAIEAYMNLNQSSVVARMALDALARWPDDPRLMEPLFFLALKHYQEEWEVRFSDHLLGTVRRSNDPDALFGLIGRCFQLARPDLAWRICERIRRIDPRHPGCLMAAAQHGEHWFTFRRQWAGFPYRAPTDRVDLRPFFRLGLDLAGWRARCRSVPFGRDLLRGPVVDARRRCLHEALENFIFREQECGLTLPLQYLLVRALEMDDDIEGARRRLEFIATQFPEEKEKTRIILSEIHEREADWSRVYEILREYPAVPRPELTPLLRLCRAQLRLHLGIAAVRTARKAVAGYPFSTRAAGMLAEAALRYESADTALFEMGERRPRKDVSLDRLQAEALYRTERYREFVAFCERALLPQGIVPPGVRQRRLLAPAEWSVYWHHVAVPSEQGFIAAAAALRRNADRTSSPFLQHLMRHWLACYDNRAKGGTADPDAWQAGGRDPVEKALLLHQLALLLCREREFAKARDAAAAALEHLPDCAPLWRAQVSLSRAEPEVILKARDNCPGDPDIWLAEVCARTQDKPGGAGETWAVNEIRRVAEARAFSAAAMTRAGEYLLRRNMNAAAAEAARDAVRRARGLLPAYVLGIKCALAERNREWALECINRSIAASVAPWPLLYRTQVMLKIAGRNVALDAEMVEALKRLREADPENLIWPRILGYVRYQRGGWEVIDALEQMSIVLKSGRADRLPYLIAGEAARVLGNYTRSVEVLQEGLRRFPDDLVLLNNLAYSLSLQPGGAREAMDYVPRLLDRGGTDLHILDTAMAVCLRAGERDLAEQLITQAVRRAPKGSALWFRARLNQAQIDLERGAVEHAHEVVRELLRQSRGIADEDIVRANQLFYRIEEERFALEQAKEGNQ